MKNLTIEVSIDTDSLTKHQLARYLQPLIKDMLSQQPEGELPNEFTLSGGKGKKIHYEHTITFTSSDG